MIPASTVSICIPTFRRPERLRSLLHSLQGLTFEKVAQPEITIVVVDSDPELSARAVIAEFLSRRFRLRYRIEWRRGISFARNAAIDASRTSDFVAFIDDDELASPAWLDELLSVQSFFNAAIVAGPVLPDFEKRPPHWIVENGFFRGRRHPTGTALNSVGAGNVLISNRVLRSLAPVWFDPRFTLTGGEDTHFFRRCSNFGFPVIWADQAVVYESVPEARLSQEYLVSRARSGANHWTRVDLELHRAPFYLGSRFAAGVFRMLQGTALTLASPALPEAKRLRGHLLWAEGLGNLKAFFGHSDDIYGS